MHYHDPYRLGIIRPKSLLLLSFNVQVIQRNTQLQIIKMIKNEIYTVEFIHGVCEPALKRLDFNTDIKENTFIKKI